MGAQAVTRIATLEHHAVIAVEGEDRVSFLQGLVSQDVTKAEPGRALWSALLTPQGKWLAEFFIMTDGERLLLDVEAENRDELIKRLSRFRLRAKVSVLPADYVVHAAWGGPAPAVSDGLVAEDVRLPQAGFRILSRAGLAANATLGEWDAHRIALGLPDGARDLEREKTVLLEAGFDELGGISWTKGCYMGQELTARTRYRGLLKRRLVPVAIDGPAPAPGTIVMTAEGRDVGTMRSAEGAQGLALLRLEVLGGAAALTAGDARLKPQVPAWMKLPEPAPSAS
jgi:folate-binding protein YgfZ